MIDPSHILCICRRGNVRSAALARILRDEYSLKDVLATGVDTTTPETMAHLLTWATVTFCIGDTYIRDHISPQHDEEVVWLNIGDDVWGNSWHPGLVDAIHAALVPYAPYLHSPQVAVINGVARPT